MPKPMLFTKVSAAGLLHAATVNEIQALRSDNSAVCPICWRVFLEVHLHNLSMHSSNTKVTKNGYVAESATLHVAPAEGNSAQASHGGINQLSQGAQLDVSQPAATADHNDELWCRSPVTLNCGHTFGMGCISEWVDSFASKPRKTNCPYCRSRIFPPRHTEELHLYSDTYDCARLAAASQHICFTSYGMSALDLARAGDIVTKMVWHNHRDSGRTPLDALSRRQRRQYRDLTDNFESALTIVYALRCRRQGIPAVTDVPVKAHIEALVEEIKVSTWLEVYDKKLVRTAVEEGPHVARLQDGMVTRKQMEVIFRAPAWREYEKMIKMTIGYFIIKSQKSR